MAKSVSSSRRLSEEVGSSRMSTWAPRDTAFRISTICRCAKPRSLTSCPARNGKPWRSMMACASRRSARPSIRQPGRRGSRPTMMLSATVMLGSRLSSWKIMAMPPSMRSSTEARDRSRPASMTVPASGRWTPMSTFMSVDLPAPFSPSRAWTSPARTSKSMPRRTWKGPKALVMPRMVTSDAADAVAPSASARSRASASIGVGPPPVVMLRSRRRCRSSRRRPADPAW